MSSPSTTGPMRFSNAGPAMPATSIGSVAGPLMTRLVGAADVPADPLPADAALAAPAAAWRGAPVARLARSARRTRPCRAPCCRRVLSRAVLSSIVFRFGGELLHQLLADVAHDAAAELRHLAGDVEVGGDGALGAGRRQRLGLGGDVGGGVPPPAGVAALGPQLRPVVHVVTLDELGLTLELGGDGAELDLHDAAVHVALDLFELRTGHARRDALHVADHRPRLLDRSVHGEFVDELLCHRRRSSSVSMSAGEPAQGICSTRSGRTRIRRASALVAGLRQQVPHRLVETHRVAAPAVVRGHRDRRRRRRDGPPRLGGDERLVGEPDHDRRRAERTRGLEPAPHRRDLTVGPVGVVHLGGTGRQRDPVRPGDHQQRVRCPSRGPPLIARWATDRPPIVASSLCPPPVKRLPAPAASRIATVISLILSTGS